MRHSPRDTIVALATPNAPGARAIIRLSGPSAAEAVRAVFHPADSLPSRNRLIHGRIRLSGVHSTLPAILYFFAAPRSYTGQDVAEFHVVSCPPLVEQLIADLLRAGCRAALPGEFTQRAFLSGKLDLTRAEAIHAVIEAGNRSDLKQALAQLAGGMAQPLTALREDLLNLLADVEAGLDFADEDLHFVEQKDMLLRLGNAMAHITLVGKQIDSRAIAGQTFRVVLTGRPNAGKSSLFNALAGARALVSEIPGTTRDYLVARFTRDGIPLELVDTPGWQAPQGEIESQAQSLAQAQLQGADLILLCVEAGHELSSEETVLAQQQHPPVERIATKCDRNRPIQGWLPTSAVAPGGQEILLQRLSERIRNRPQVSLAPSLSRCKAHVAVCLDHLRRAHAVVLEEDPPEILALELREALAQLGEMVGAVYTDDLLDRIFSRFCIGK